MDYQETWWGWRVTGVWGWVGGCTHGWAKTLGAGRSVDKPKNLLEKSTDKLQSFPYKSAMTPRAEQALMKFDTCHVCDEQRNYVSDTADRHHCPKGSQASRYQVDHVSTRKPGKRTKKGAHSVQVGELVKFRTWSELPHPEASARTSVTFWCYSSSYNPAGTTQQQAGPGLVRSCFKHNLPVQLNCLPSASLSHASSHPFFPTQLSETEFPAQHTSVTNQNVAKSCLSQSSKRNRERNNLYILRSLLSYKLLSLIWTIGGDSIRCGD